MKIRISFNVISLIFLRAFSRKAFSKEKKNVFKFFSLLCTFQMLINNKAIKIKFNEFPFQVEYNQKLETLTNEN